MTRLGVSDLDSKVADLLGLRLRGVGTHPKRERKKNKRASGTWSTKEHKYTLLELPNFYFFLHFYLFLLGTFGIMTSHK